MMAALLDSIADLAGASRAWLSNSIRRLNSGQFGGFIRSRAVNSGGAPAIELRMRIGQTSTRKVNWIAQRAFCVIDRACRVHDIE